VSYRGCGVKGARELGLLAFPSAFAFDQDCVTAGFALLD